MEKQTAVEWLVSEIANHIDMPHKHFKELIDQAKEMEKEQIIDLYSELEMLDFAWFLVKNIGQYSCDETAHFEGKYLEQFKSE